MDQAIRESVDIDLLPGSNNVNLAVLGLTPTSGVNSTRGCGCSRTVETSATQIDGSSAPGETPSNLFERLPFSRVVVDCRTEGAHKPWRTTLPPATGTCLFTYHLFGH